MRTQPAPLTGTMGVQETSSWQFLATLDLIFHIFLDL
jgi:hypothetical protein